MKMTEFKAAERTGKVEMESNTSHLVEQRQSQTSQKPQRQFFTFRLLRYRCLTQPFQRDQMRKGGGGEGGLREIMCATETEGGTRLRVMNRDSTEKGRRRESETESDRDRERLSSSS